MILNITAGADIPTMELLQIDGKMRTSTARPYVVVKYDSCFCTQKSSTMRTVGDTGPTIQPYSNHTSHKKTHPFGMRLVFLFFAVGLFESRIVQNFTKNKALADDVHVVHFAIVLRFVHQIGGNQTHTVEFVTTFVANSAK